MKKILLSLAFAALLVPANAASFMIDGKEYSYDLITSKSVGPGTVYNRIRIPDFPLNVNYMVVDLNNPYNSIETQQANEKTGTTEKLAAAYTRMQQAGKKPIGAQNGNFWVVNGQGISSQFALGTSYNACLRNGKIVNETNAHNDQWDGGPARTGVVGLDTEKNLRIESMSWRGYVKSESVWGGAQHEFYLANKYCRAAGEMVLYNSFYGKDKKFQTIKKTDGTWSTVDNVTCEVYLNLDPGAEWKTNGDINATVQLVRKDCEAGSLGEYDACLCGTASYKTELEKLKPGDKVQLNYAWTSVATGAPYNLTQAIGGNSMVLVNGELTERNYDEGYNTQVYSRSAYGMSQDGKTLYMFVIDKSNDPVYGRSDGCNTSVMCQIMKQLGAYNVCNVDAGGSAQLMVQGAVVNKTTESTPRAVANGWMVYSVAPNDDKSNVIARIEFLDPEIKLPIYTTYKPVILGYNAYGELISENVEGIIMECDAAIGTANGNRVDVGGTPGTATVTAKYGDVTVTKEATIVNAEVAIRIQNILLDGRDYPVEIVANTGYKEYACDPSRVVWSVEDETVATITNGVMKGLKNGTTKITGSIGGFATTANVTIELPEGPTMPVYRNFPTDAVIKQVGGTGITMTEFENGFKLNYVGKTGRGQYIEITKAYPIWSLPEKLKIRINPGETKISKITATAKNALGVIEAVWTATESDVPEKQYSEYEFKLSDWCDPEDVACFPITLEKLRFTTSGSVANQEYEILVSNFEAVYANAQGGITENIVTNTLKVYPNPVTDGNINVVMPEGASGAVAIYNMAGGKVLECAAEGTQSINVGNLQAGIYLVEAICENGKHVSRIIVK